MNDTDRIKTLIVDDEKHARERLKQVLTKFKEVEVVEYCGDGDEAINAIHNLKPDLVFLDIEMPDTDGFKVVSEIDPSDAPLIVFVTAFSKYAMRAFEVNAHDYIHKPIREDRVQTVIEKTKKHLLIRKNAVNGLAEEIRTGSGDHSSKEKEYAERYVLKSGSTIKVVKQAEVEWIEASGNYVRLVHKGKKYMVRSTLTGFLEQLNQEKFFQIHKSTIINLEYVDRFEELLYGDYKVIMKNGQELKLSRGYNDFLKTIS